MSVDESAFISPQKWQVFILAFSHPFHTLISEWTSILLMFIFVATSTSAFLLSFKGEISDADNATNSIKFKYKYSSHHLQSPLTTATPSSMIHSTAHSTNAHRYAINPHLHPPQNPRPARTHRHPPMDSQRWNPVLAPLHLPQIRLLQRRCKLKAEHQATLECYTET